jgi:hypothetical protein
MHLTLTLISFSGANPQLVQYALRVFGSTDLTDDQWRQCEDQIKVTQQILISDCVGTSFYDEQILALPNVQEFYSWGMTDDNLGTLKHLNHCQLFQLIYIYIYNI